MAAPALQGAIITYAPPALVGANVSYVAVSESSGTDPVPLYGAPTISGNNLVFSNMNFTASSINATPASDFTDGQLNFTVQSSLGLNAITLSESGDYNVSPFPNASSINSAKVFSQKLQITVLEINNVALGVPLVNNTSVAMVLSPFGGSYQTVLTPDTGSWAGSAVANLVALFGSDQITKVAISYNNQLAAASQTGGIASISKKSVIVVPDVFPEPASFALVGLGVFGILSSRRRKTN